MTFTTPTFLVFLTLVFGVYWMLRHTQQNYWLLAASLTFYAWWDWRFLGLLIGAAGLDFVVGLALASEPRERRRKALLALSIAGNLGTLAVFKYADFFIASFQRAAGTIGLELDPFALRLILPLGISFYTFQALSYTIDVYRRQLEPVRDPVAYMCFITFFPQLVAGPIERASNLLDQFERPRHFDEALAADGARQMLWGFFKKLVVADNLAVIVNAAYGDAGTASGWQLIWASYAFAFQIYCDFSGYTDIAIGCARLFGFNLMRNFAFPYFSRDIPEFWRRWHISLSSWFRDYLYVPLGGSRVSPGRRARNVFAVFVISGFWHGANWTFVVWGLLHGLFYSAMLPIVRRRDAADTVPGGRRLIPRGRDLLLIVLTFHLTTLAWVFFRAPSVGDALRIIWRIASSVNPLDPQMPAHPVAFVFVALLLLVEWAQRRRQHALQIAALPRPVRHLVYYATVAAILLYAQLDYTPFIYFQF